MDIVGAALEGWTEDLRLEVVEEARAETRAGIMDHGMSLTPILLVDQGKGFAPVRGSGTECRRETLQQA